ncbi:HEAT repeat domain-containing protein [Sorangium sp. So ce1036]|uniref:HEAT repeat domain-containing protein n=1 Tax=Sorangium sp. So ce1036 TaxID=3133328 RepID=UPI003EFBE29B
MFGLAPAKRTFEAALRDVASLKPAVRAEAVGDLVPYAATAREQVLRALENALRSDAHASVRAAAAIALADTKAVEALPALLLAVEDADAHVRQMAITALGEIGDARATGRLRRALSDERPEVRFQAVIAFPRVCTEKADAIDAILRATHDDDPLVCHIALRMFEELGEALGELPASGMERARALLGHASPLVQAAAAVVLARFDDPAGHPVLVAIAERRLRDVDHEDEAAAIELCGELGLSEATSALERRAFGLKLGLGRDPLRWHARVALARMGHARAVREILGDLGAWDRHRRTLAVAAAGRARLAAALGPIAAMRGDERRADQGAVEEALAALGAATAPGAAPPGG